MKIPNKWELQQIAFNHLSDIDFKDFTNLYKKCAAVPYSSSVIHVTLGKDNRSRFKKNLLKCIWKPIMTFDGNITDEKLHNDIDREAKLRKLPALSSGKSDDIHKYLTDNSM